MDVPLEYIASWISEVKEEGIRSIICLLDEKQLRPYLHAVPEGLVEYYKQSGFDVYSVPTEDGGDAYLWPDEIDEICKGYDEMEKPVLIHCSAGVERSPLAASKIKERMGA